MKSFKVKTLDSGQRPPWLAKLQVMPSLSQVCVCWHPAVLFFFFILENFYWRIIALQCCVGFCYTTMWISYKYALIPPSWGFPSGSASKESTGNAGDTDEGSTLGWEDPLEEEMATHSSILVWEVPWTEEPDGLQSKGSQRVKHKQTTKHLLTLPLELPSNTHYPAPRPTSPI